MPTTSHANAPADIFKEPLLEPADAGRALNCTSRMVRVLSRQGKLIPIARTVRGVRLYSAADVFALAQERALRPHHPRRGRPRRVDAA